MIKRKNSRYQEDGDCAICALVDESLTIDNIKLSKTTFKKTPHLKHLTVNSRFDYRFLSYLPTELDYLILTVRSADNADYYGFDNYVNNDDLFDSIYNDAKKKENINGIKQNLNPMYILECYIEYRVRELFSEICKQVHK